MRVLAVLMCSALAMSGCVTGAQRTKSVADLTNKDTLDLCKIAFTDSDEAYRIEAARLAVRRGAAVDKCQRIIANDRTIATGIAVVGTAAAVGAVAPAGGYGSPYGAAWDRFPDGQWRCRNRSNGQFLPDNHCGGPPVYDAWP